ncbi:unnamed protein product [Microthlaspi erraticum]|uniref:F-box domain-containing protein n=1 Tax=Microthlaspi erraticum TaxID=1685480 RepID=A0A6D2KMP7_9BRAS|nr:unnamed protein product [Microthlaspi erraticum]
MASNPKADEPQDNNQQLASLSSLPHEIVLSCLARVPRSCHLNLTHVSKTLRSLIRSRELRSLLHKKNSLYVYLHNPKNKTYHWLTLLHCEETMISYRLAPIPFPCHPFMRHSSSVAVGSEIYYVGGSFRPSSDLWILDTRSGKFHQGPSMKVPCRGVDTWLGVIDGKIYVVG